MPAIGYMMCVGQTGCPGSGDWIVTPVAVSLRCRDRLGEIEGEVRQRSDSARPDLRIMARDDLHLPRAIRRSLMIAVCRTYRGCADDYCAEEWIVYGRVLAGWMDERFDYRRSARLLACIEKRLLQHGRIVQPK